jgi:ribonuclease BN (tRNA processing enzyme)
MRVTFLGTANAFFSGGRAQSSILVADRQGHLLLECGVTTPFLLKKHGIDPASIDSIVVSHFHGDHFGGLAFLLLEARDESPRRVPLYLIGPLGLAAQVRALLLALYPESDPGVWPFALHYVEISPGETRVVAGRRIQAFRADHMSERYSALCLRIETEGKTLAFTGDTGAAAPLEELAKGADLLICECTLSGTTDVESQPQHLSPPELIRRRGALTSKRVILTHLTRESRERAALIPGIEIADDGMELEI